MVPHADGCDGVTLDFTVTVYPVPDLFFNPSTPSICSNQQTNIGLNSHVTGAAFSWSASASSPTVTGFSGGNGTLIAQTLLTPGFQQETVTYHITPAANGCSGSLSITP